MVKRRKIFFFFLIRSTDAQHCLTHHTFTSLHLASTLLLACPWLTFLPPSFYLASNSPPTLINILNSDLRIRIRIKFGSGSASATIFRWQAKHLEYEPIWGLFRFWVFCSWKLGSGSASKWKLRSGSGPHHRHTAFHPCYLSGPPSRVPFLVLRGAGLDQFADDKPKCMELWDFLNNFSMFWVFIWKLGSGSASKWG